MTVNDLMLGVIGVVSGRKFLAICDGIRDCFCLIAEMDLYSFKCLSSPCCTTTLHSRRNKLFINTKGLLDIFNILQHITRTSKVDYLSQLWKFELRGPCFAHGSKQEQESEPKPKQAAPWVSQAAQKSWLSWTSWAP